MKQVMFKAQMGDRVVGIPAMQLTDPDDEGKFWIDLPAAPPVVNQSCLQHVTMDILVQEEMQNAE